MTVQTMNSGGLPRGELLGRYRTYDEAQKVVDHLAQAEGFNIKTISIVGNDLRSVEYIRSRLSYPRVAGAGAAQGAMFGFFIGLLLFLFAPEAPLANLLMSVLLGMAIWMIIGVISYAIRRGKRDFSSSTQMVATTYDVVCDFSVAGRARKLVAEAGVTSLNAWNDPTGRSVSLGGGPSAGASRSAHDDVSSGGQGAAGGAGAPSAPRGYDDLPDGRPRFGVRREEPRPEEPQAESVPREDAEAKTAGQGTASASLTPGQGASEAADDAQAADETQPAAEDSSGEDADRPNEAR
ncbi:general stress protein [Nesterenkonia flava]|uniref:General stress protein n=1 Tax=Nesterenkonia flava TaxID=469799 RepID=A0ABU1FT75_9MICC|nr:general stress protein [Nesterenkonia flava]MDR5711860.1 general stress protein [Nesterenkonia flava]